MGGSMLGGPVRQKLVEPSLKNKTGVVAHICDPSYMGKEGE
jgi:hypothetical protein